MSDLLECASAPTRKNKSEAIIGRSDNLFELLAPSMRLICQLPAETERSR